MVPCARSSANTSPCQVATYTIPALTRGALVIRSPVSNDHSVCPLVKLSAHRLLSEPRPTYTAPPATAGTPVVGQATAPRWNFHSKLPSVALSVQRVVREATSTRLPTTSGGASILSASANVQYNEPV